MQGSWQCFEIKNCIRLIDIIQGNIYMTDIVLFHPANTNIMNILVVKNRYSGNTRCLTLFFGVLKQLSITIIFS